MSETNSTSRFMVALLLLLVASPLLAQVADPMRPPQAREASEPAPKPSWDLSSILISDSRRVVVINNQLLTVGDRVNGARVLRIEADRVILRRGDASMTLTLRADLDIRRSSENREAR